MDVERIAEIARKLWFLAQVQEVLIVEPAELDPCSVCPEPRHDDEPGPAPSDAVVAYRTADGRWVYREPVCLDDLTRAVRQIAETAAVVWVEVPAVVIA